MNRTTAALLALNSGCTQPWFCGHRYAIGMLNKATGQMQAMNAEAGRIIRMEPRCPGVDYEDTGAGVRSEPLDAETRMKEYKR